MRTFRGNRAAALVGAVVVTLLGAAGLAQAVAEPPRTRGTDRALPCGGDHWVVSWLSPPQSSSLGRPDDVEGGLADGSARAFTNQSVRIITTPHVAGSAIRVHLGNRYGTAPLTLSSVTIGARALDAAVAPGTIQSLTFGGRREVVIAVGTEAISDPLFVDVRPFQKLAVTFAVAGTAALDYHQWAQQTSYVAPVGSGDHAAEAGGSAFTEEISSTYAVTAIDVLTRREVGGVVAIGDSITDGIGSSPNTDRRWPDQLARRALDTSTPLGVVDAGIGGNHVASGRPERAIGDAIEDRIGRDVLEQAGVTDVIVLAGINDLFTAPEGTDVTTAVIRAYRGIIKAAHAAGVRVTIATITPASLPYAAEQARRAVNAWIRTNGDTDRVVDFDAAVRDPNQRDRLRPSFDAAMAHLTDAGYAAMAKSVDLNALQGTGCRS